MNSRGMLVPVLLVCVALGVQAAPKSRSRPAHLAMKQVTTEIFDQKGQVVGTKREVKITMHDGKGKSWTADPVEYIVRNGNEFESVNSLRFVKNDRGLVGNPIPQGGSGMIVSTHLEKGILEPKTDEDGTRIVGTWTTQQWPATETSAAYTERVETWFRAAKGPDDVLGLLPHREVRSSLYERRTTDWWYMASNRFHPSMFSTEKVVEPAQKSAER